MLPQRLKTVPKTPSEPAAKQKITEEEMEMETENNSVSMNILNDDCLQHVFQFLSFRDLIRIERVCQKWKANSLMTWRKLKKVSIGNGNLFPAKYLQMEHLKKIFERCKNYVTHLDIEDDLEYLDPGDVFEMIDEYCKKLIHFTVGDLYVTDKELNVENYPFLKKLKSFHGYLYTLHYDDELSMDGILTFLEKTSVLEDFHISDRTEGFITVEDGGKKVQVSGIEMEYIIDTLDLHRLLSRFLQVEELSIITVPQLQIFEHLASISNQLKSLSVANNYDDFLEGSKYKRLQWNNLRELNIGYNGAINDDVILNFVTKCPLLEDLDVEGCKFVTNNGFRTIGNLKELKKLEVTHTEITVKTLQYIAGNCSKLQTISHHDLDFSDDELSSIVFLLPDLNYMALNSLHYLTTKGFKLIYESVQQRINGVNLKIYFSRSTTEDAEKLSLKRESDLSSKSNTFLTIIVYEWVEYSPNSSGTRYVNYFYSDE